MSQVDNDYLFEQLGNGGYSFGEDIFLFAGASTVQAGAYPVKDQCHRVVANSVSGAALVMKSILSNENPGMVWIINDSPNTIKVFPYTGGTVDTTESMNGTPNGSLSITTLNAGYFYASVVQTKRKGGSGTTTPALNWVGVLLT